MMMEKMTGKMTTKMIMIVVTIKTFQKTQSGTVLCDITMILDLCSLGLCSDTASHTGHHCWNRTNC